MIQNRILIDKPNLSLNYNTNTGVLSGDNVFKVDLINIGDEVSDDNEIIITHDSDIVVSPSKFTIEDGYSQSVSIRLAEDVELEDGNYNFTLNLSNKYSVTQNTTTSILANTNEIPEPMNYKLKYYIDRGPDRINIFQNVLQSTILEPIEINGTFEHKYQDRNDLLQPIVSSTLTLNLEASLDLTLEDLYSEDERTFLTELKHNDEVRFIGYMFPDDIWGDFVSDKWILKITANDGLSTLKNISFSNENGSNLFGRMTAINIIDICLRKTGLNLFNNIFCEVTYDGGWNGYDYTVFSNIYLSIERYLQNKDEPMDCESVLKSILQLFNCCLMQQQGMWFIYRPGDLKSTNRFSKYSGASPNEVNLINVSESLGSHINNFENFHCNGNQKYSISGSIQAYKIMYEYGLSYSFFLNQGLYFEGTGLNMIGWIVNNPDGLVQRDPSGHGLKSVTKWFGGNAPPLLTLNQSINVTAGSALKLRIEYSNESKFKQPNSDSSKGLTYSIGIGGQWLAADGSWVSSQQRIFISNSNEVSEPTFNGFLGKGLAIYEADIVSPLTGLLQIIIWRDKHEIGGGFFYLYSVNVTGSNQSQTKGIEYLGRRTSKTSTKIKSNVTVYNGDSITDLFVGTIYKSDSDTPTETWTRFDYDDLGNLQPYYDNAPILSINAEDNLRISPRPMLIFEGDFKGYINYLSVVTIDGFEKEGPFGMIPRTFQFTRWTYNYDTDITRAVFKEFETRVFNDDEYNIKTFENFGEETKVTLLQ